MFSLGHREGHGQPLACFSGKIWDFNARVFYFSVQFCTSDCNTGPKHPQSIPVLLSWINGLSIKFDLFPYILSTGPNNQLTGLVSQIHQDLLDIHERGKLFLVTALPQRSYVSATIPELTPDVFYNQMGI